LLQRNRILVSTNRKQKLYFEPSLSGGSFIFYCFPDPLTLFRKESLPVQGRDQFVQAVRVGNQRVRRLQLFKGLDIGFSSSMV
jgi:hypothetical protein